MRASEIALEVAKVLTVISVPPDPRSQPRAGDLKGRFDVWFDGGAAKHDTGISVYRFLDGATATTASSLKFAVVIRLPDGTFVQVLEKDQAELHPTALLGFDER